MALCGNADILLGEHKCKLTHLTMNPPALGMSNPRWSRTIPLCDNADCENTGGKEMKTKRPCDHCTAQYGTAYVLLSTLFVSKIILGHVKAKPEALHGSTVSSHAGYLQRRPAQVVR